MHRSRSCTFLTDFLIILRILQLGYHNTREQNMPFLTVCLFQSRWSITFLAKLFYPHISSRAAFCPCLITRLFFSIQDHRLRVRLSWNTALGPNDAQIWSRCGANFCSFRFFYPDFDSDFRLSFLHHSIQMHQQGVILSLTISSLESDADFWDQTQEFGSTIWTRKFQEDKVSCTCSSTLQLFQVFLKFLQNLGLSLEALDLIMDLY